MLCPRATPLNANGRISICYSNTRALPAQRVRSAGIMGWSRRWRYRGLYLTLPAIQEVAKGLGIEAVPYFTQNMLGDVDLIDAFLTLHLSLIHI